MESHVNVFVTQLHFKHTPKGLARAYEDAQTEENATLDRLFLDVGGPAAWLALFLLKRAAASGTHFDGQAACSHTLKALQEMPEESRRSLAQAVTQALPPETISRFCEVLEKAVKSVRTGKRRHTIDDDGDSLATAIPGWASPVPGVVMPEAIQTDTAFDLGNPPVLNVAIVLPRFAASAVRRQHRNGGLWTAAITMSFFDASSFGNRFGCMMSVEISSNKVERLARELFDAHVESTGDHRYLVQPNGLRIIPSPDLILRGCKPDVISTWLGADIDMAVKVCPAFQEEAAQGNPLTECVSMTISGRATDGAIINLSLDEKEGLRIKRKLYE